MNDHEISVPFRRRTATPGRNVIVEFPIVPLAGVGPVRFGMTRTEVESVLGAGRDVSEARQVFMGALFVAYDREGRVEFIEAADSTLFRVTLFGQHLHSLTARAVIAFLRTVAPYDVDDPQLGYSYIFPKLQMSLWRATIPDEEDEESGKYFDAVGAGRFGYFDLR